MKESKKNKKLLGTEFKSITLTFEDLEIIRNSLYGFESQEVVKLYNKINEFLGYERK